MRYRFWHAVDSAAHLVYCPGMAGRRMVRARWYHAVHLMPRSWLGWVCDRFDLACGLTHEEL